MVGAKPSLLRSSQKGHPAGASVTLLKTKAVLVQTGRPLLFESREAWCCLHCDVQVLRAADDERPAPLRLLVQQAELREALDERTDRDLCLRARQAGTQAEMDAVAACEVGCRVARAVESFGMLVMGGVPVAG